MTMRKDTKNDAWKYSMIGQSGKYERTTKTIGKYAGKAFGYEMKVLILQQEETDYEEPKLPTDPTETDMLVWGKQYDLFAKKKEQYLEDKAKMFAVIFGHCDEMMKNGLETTEEKQEEIIRKEFSWMN